jgi:tetratricopeptide (TPR) repeat protein
MLETIREYALERLDATGETPQVRMRHAVHYAEFAGRAGAGLKGPQERAWLAQVEDELDNLRAAVMWSLASGDTHLACACVCALGLQGLRIEPVVSAWADSITECAAAHDDPAYPVALALAGYARMGEGRSDRAAELCNAALARLDEATVPPAVVCRVLSCASATESIRGLNSEEHGRQWVRAARDARDDYERALGLNMVAVGQTTAGDPAAHDTAEESVRVARASGSPSAIAYCLFTNAMVDAPNDPDRALELLEESLRSAEAAANTFAAITAAGIRNALLVQSGQYEAAARAYLGEAQRALQYGRRDHQASMLFQLAACLVAQGKPEPAAIIDGWIRSIVGREYATARGGLYALANEAIARLPETLGADRYATLSAVGAAMTAAQILDHAKQDTTPPGTTE